MCIDDHVIHTRRDGVLGDTTEEDVRRIVAAGAASGRIVLHVHGGLNTKQKGYDKARRLLPFYRAAPSYPVFPCWETGVRETLRRNWREIAAEDLFRRLLPRVLRWAAGKLLQPPSHLAAGRLAFPPEATLASEIGRRELGEEPFAELAPAPPAGELTEGERERFEMEVFEDGAIHSALRAAVEEALPPGRRSAVVKLAKHRARTSKASLMSPEVVAQLVEDLAAAGGTSLPFTAGIFRSFGAVLHRVVLRFLRRRDHGLYATVVEEICRELYLTNAGALVWGLMKRDARATFEKTPDEVRGGWLFVRCLGEAIRGGARPEVSVVAHSAGSVWTSHLLAHAAAAREDGGHPLPADFRFDHVVFLAPAVRFDVFADTVGEHAALMGRFRMFTLDDPRESGYWEIPYVYPRSLLYMVSGTMETEPDGSSAFDMPLVGMQRYHAARGTYRAAAVRKVRDYVAAEPGRAVWSVEDRGPALSADTVEHGAFDRIEPAPARTMESVLATIRGD